MKRTITLIILIAVSLTLAAQDYSPCYTASMDAGEAAWQQGKYQEAREHFLDATKCHNGNREAAKKRVKECNKKIKESKGSEMKAEDNAYRNCTSVPKCNEYLNKYPEGRYVAEVTKMKQDFQAEDAAFMSCLTVQKCNEYLDKYPNGRYVTEVTNKLRQLTEQLEQTQARKEFTVNGVTFTMVKVDGGTFTMGCTSGQNGECDHDEKPSHTVNVSDFWMGETEVTQGLWEAVMRTSINQQRDKSDSRALYGEGVSYPMYYVSWEECVQFCDKLNQMLKSKLPSGWKFSLPTEAQWEYAARGGKNSQDYMYAGSDDIEEVAWYEANSGGRTHMVKGKKANTLGLYDMSGNVYEWCADWFDGAYYSVSSSTDPQGPSTGTRRVLRDVCWTDRAKGCRVTNRNSDDPSNRNGYTGFRISLVRR